MPTFPGNVLSKFFLFCPEENASYSSKTLVSFIKMHSITHRKPYNIATLVKTSNPVHCTGILHSSSIERKFGMTVEKHSSYL